MSLSRLNQGLDRMCMSVLLDASVFSTETFDGTGALDKYASDANPAEDINEHLRPFRYLQGFAGFSLEAFIGSEVARILRGYPDYAGTPLYDAQRGKVFTPDAAFSSNFQQTHSLDAVHVFKGVYNTGQMGQTAVPTRLHAGLLWIGFVDRRQSTWDLRVTGNNRAMGPDGGIALAMSPLGRYLWPWKYTDGREVEAVNARASVDIITPQDTAFSVEMGIFYPSTEIFT